MPKTASTARSAQPLLTLLAPLAVLAGAYATIDPGADLERGLDTAARAEVLLAGDLSPPRAPQGTTPRALAQRTVEEGSEAFWLTRAPQPPSVARVTWSAPVTAGDQIVANFGPLNQQVLEVVKVEAAPELENSTRIDTGAPLEPRYLLTCRKASDPDGALVHLEVDATGHGIRTLGSTDRSL